jgi:hypothetical protein
MLEKIYREETQKKSGVARAAKIMRRVAIVVAAAGIVGFYFTLFYLAPQ